MYSKILTKWATFKLQKLQKIINRGGWKRDGGGSLFGTERSTRRDNLAMIIFDMTSRTFFDPLFIMICSLWNLAAFLIVFVENGRHFSKTQISTEDFLSFMYAKNLFEGFFSITKVASPVLKLSQIFYEEKIRHHAPLERNNSIPKKFWMRSSSWKIDLTPCSISTDCFASVHVMAVQHKKC